jgi:hypothetical protein
MGLVRSKGLVRIFVRLDALQERGKLNVVLEQLLSTFLLDLFGRTFFAGIDDCCWQQFDKLLDGLLACGR